MIVKHFKITKQPSSRRLRLRISTKSKQNSNPLSPSFQNLFEYYPMFQKTRDVNFEFEPRRNRLKRVLDRSRRLRLECCSVIQECFTITSKLFNCPEQNVISYFYTSPYNDYSTQGIKNGEIVNDSTKNLISAILLLSPIIDENRFSDCNFVVRWYRCKTQSMHYQKLCQMRPNYQQSNWFDGNC